MKIKRKKTRRIYVGRVAVGGGAPVAVQSMTKTQTPDAAATLEQIGRLDRAGCEIVRVAVPDKRSLKSFKQIKECSPLPVVADIHFLPELALGALDAGADCVRVNPGNMGGAVGFRDVARTAARLGRSVRIGVNAGSLEPKLAKNNKMLLSDKLVRSALVYAEAAEKAGLMDYKLSLKASDVTATVDAYRQVSKLTDAPLHVGVTEAGCAFSGAIKSGVGIGILLAEGIGDTIRVSMSEEPEVEVRAAWEILRALDIRRRGVEVISCPTCSRTTVDVGAVAEEIGRASVDITQPVRVAVMGCEVNGPGESKGADLALVMDRKGFARIYVHGEPVRRVSAAKSVREIVSEMIKMTEKI